VIRDSMDRPAFTLVSAALCVELDCNTVFDASDRRAVPALRERAVSSARRMARSRRSGRRPGRLDSSGPGAGRVARRVAVSARYARRCLAKKSVQRFQASCAAAALYDGR
jgi:hypothetical protein